MNCGDRRLIIYVSGAMALGMIVLVGMLTFKNKPIPSELWMSLGGISTGLFGIFSQRSSQQQKVEERNEKEV